MADIQAIAQQFTNFYYQTFDAAGKDRSALSSLYRDNSMMTWEGTQLMGTQAIIEKINSLPFESVQHRVSMIDAQPSSATVASLIVLVTGHLVVDGNVDAPMPYSQMFQLVPDNGSYYVYVPAAAVIIVHSLILVLVPSTPLQPKRRFPTCLGLTELQDIPLRMRLVCEGCIRGVVQVPMMMTGP